MIQCGTAALGCENCSTQPRAAAPHIKARTTEHEGRSRPFPPKAVFGPAFTPGAGERGLAVFPRGFGSVSRVYAARPLASDRSPVDRADEMVPRATIDPA